MCKTLNQYSEVSIIEKLLLEKHHTYLVIFLRTGKVQNNFDCKLSYLPMTQICGDTITNSVHFEDI